MSTQSSTEGAHPVENVKAELSDSDSANDHGTAAKPSILRSNSHESGGSFTQGRQKSLGKDMSLPPLQVQKSRSVNWAREETVGDSEGASQKPKLPTTPYPLSANSERIVASKIQELEALESPQLRELARRLGRMYSIKPRGVERSSSTSNRSRPHPYSEFDVGERWQEIQGCNRWEGLLDPLDPVLRQEIVRYGEFAQATYDSFDGDTTSKYCGSSRYKPDELLEKVGLENRGYKLTQFLYATSDLDLPKFFSKSMDIDTWSKDSNWIGFVAVCVSKEEIARLGRRDIVVAWRGTIRRFEWIEDLRDYRTPAGFDPRNEHMNVKVEGGFLSVYKSSNGKSRWNKQSAREQVLGAVKKLVEEYKHKGQMSITVLGHSLGSALATLCGYDIAESQMNLLSSTPTVPTNWDQKPIWENPAEKESSIPKGASEGQQAEKKGGPAEESLQGAAAAAVSGKKFPSDRIPITVFSYAGPRVGNRAFRDRVEELGVAVLRVVNVHDFVTKLPGTEFDQDMNFVRKLTDLIPLRYKHVGKKLKVDNLQSEYLEHTRDPIHAHCLEAYLHLVDSFHGTGLEYKTTMRDYALVNKGSDFLRRDLFIPPHWWQEANKGLVKDEDGHWVLPVRDAEIYPKTPAQVSQDNEQHTADFKRSVSIAAERSKKLSEGGQGQALESKAAASGKERTKRPSAGEQGLAQIAAAGKGQAEQPKPAASVAERTKGPSGGEQGLAQIAAAGQGQAEQPQAAASVVERSKGSSGGEQGLPQIAVVGQGQAEQSKAAASVAERSKGNSGGEQGLAQIAAAGQGQAVQPTAAASVVERSKGSSGREQGLAQIAAAGQGQAEQAAASVVERSKGNSGGEQGLAQIAAAGQGQAEQSKAAAASVVGRSKENSGGEEGLAQIAAVGQGQAEQSKAAASVVERSKEFAGGEQGPALIAAAGKGQAQQSS